MWFSQKVEKGDGSGQKIGFPTVNLNPGKIKGIIKEGIYAARVRYKNQIYPAVLFYGPRLVMGESNNVLEIHIIGFKRIIYGQYLEYEVKNFIRNVKNFDKFDELAREIAKDIAIASKLLTNNKDLV